MLILPEEEGDLVIIYDQLRIASAYYVFLSWHPNCRHGGGGDPRKRKIFESSISSLEGERNSVQEQGGRSLVIRGTRQG